MNLLSDIFSVLMDHWRLISGLLLVMLFSQSLIRSVLKMIFHDDLSSEEYYSLGIAGWIFPLSLASLLWLGLGRLQRPTWIGLGLLICVAILAIFLFLRTRKEPVSGSKAIVWILAALFGVFIFLRLAFVSKVIVPLYFDSAQHYLIIKDLIRNLPSYPIPFFSGSATRYYHIGFHLLTALTASTLRADIIPATLILGQMIVVAIPFSVFSVIKQETQSNSAGIFAVLLAAFGWYMPAYAVNWGKYPALTSLPLITLVASLAYLSLRYRGVLSSGKYLALNTLLLSGILITGFIHSRALVVFGIIALAWIAVAGWQRLSKMFRSLSFGVILLGLILEIAYIRTQDIFGLLFDPYWEKGLFMTAVVLILSFFAQWAYPRLALTSLLTIFFLLGSLLIPVRVPGYGNLTLLDRPFVEMILYLPLSLLGGTGLAGLEQGLHQLPAQWQARRFWPGKYLSGLLIGLLFINTFLHYNLYPADCCSIVGRDDLVVIYWIDKNLPSDARILISSTELRVIASDSPQGAAGGDAGTWITPLTDRVTIPFPYQSDFSQQATFSAVCQKKSDYLYIGEIGARFNNEQIASDPDRYRILLAMPNAKVYQVIGCPEHSASNQIPLTANSIP